MFLLLGWFIAHEDRRHVCESSRDEKHTGNKPRLLDPTVKVKETTTKGQPDRSAVQLSVNEQAHRNNTHRINVINDKSFAVGRNGNADQIMYTEFYRRMLWP